VIADQSLGGPAPIHRRWGRPDPLKKTNMDNSDSVQKWKGFMSRNFDQLLKIKKLSAMIRGQ